MAKTATANNSTELQKLIEIGKDRGFLTYDEINDALPHEGFSVDDMDSLLETLGEMGIEEEDRPVRIYMKEMGAVSLLNREEEVVLAKEIEDGRNELKRLTFLSPFASREALRIAERIKEDKMSIRELMEEVDETSN